MEFQRVKSKLKLAPDPRNLAWSNDEKKFGQRMLQKMGWTPGKGLGRKQDGLTEHIRVSVKDNLAGVGCKDGTDATWRKHHANFSDLLQQLHASTASSAAPTTVGSPENSVTCSENKKKKRKDGAQRLQDKVKESKTKIFYHRSAKGKDLSSRSDQDMAAIFGGTTQNSRHSDDSESEGTDSNHGVNTITGKSDSRTYFEEKMRAVSTTTDKSRKFNISGKKSHKKCRKMSSANIAGGHNMSHEASSNACHSNSINATNSKRKRKWKESGGESPVWKNVQKRTEIGEVDEESSCGKKKRVKKKKLSNAECEMAEIEPDSETNVENGIIRNSKMFQNVRAVAQETKGGKKMKNRHTSETSESETVDAVLMNFIEAENKKKKQKKKKKRKDKAECSLSDGVENITCVEKGEGKKSMKQEGERVFSADNASDFFEGVQRHHYIEKKKREKMKRVNEKLQDEREIDNSAKLKSVSSCAAGGMLFEMSESSAKVVNEVARKSVTEKPMESNVDEFFSPVLTKQIEEFLGKARYEVGISGDDRDVIDDGEEHGEKIVKLQIEKEAKSKAGKSKSVREDIFQDEKVREGKKFGAGKKLKKKRRKLENKSESSYSGVDNEVLTSDKNAETSRMEYEKKINGSNLNTSNHTLDSESNVENESRTRERNASEDVEGGKHTTTTSKSLGLSCRTQSQEDLKSKVVEYVAPTANRLTPGSIMVGEGFTQSNLNSFWGYGCGAPLEKGASKQGSGSVSVKETEKWATDICQVETKSAKEGTALTREASVEIAKHPTTISKRVTSDTKAQEDLKSEVLNSLTRTTRKPYLDLQSVEEAFTRSNLNTIMGYGVHLEKYSLNE